MAPVTTHTENLERLVGEVRVGIAAYLAREHRTAQALAPAVDLHRNTLHLWLSDQRENISLTTLRKLAAWLDHNPPTDTQKEALRGGFAAVIRG